MKKKLILLAVALLVIAVGAGSAVSYFSSKDTADNVFTVGNVKIELTEEGWDPNDDHVIGPSASFDKKPQVKNTGDTEAYVRINMTISKVNFLLALADDETPVVKELFEGYDSDIWPRTGGSGQDLDKDTYNGIYTYYLTLKPGETTAPLFESVNFPNAISADAMNLLDGNVEIEFTADAIQAEGFENAEEAFKAFDEKRA